MRPFHAVGMRPAAGLETSAALNRSECLVVVGLPTLRLEPRQIRKEATVLHSECGGPLPFCSRHFVFPGVLLTPLGSDLCICESEDAPAVEA